MKLDIGPINGLDIAGKAFIDATYNLVDKVLWPYFSINADKIEDFVLAIKEQFGGVFDNRTLNDTIIFKCGDDSQFRLSGLINTKRNLLLIISNNIENGQAFINHFTEFLIKKDPSNIFVDYYYLNTDGIGSNEIEIDKTKVEKIYPELYPDYDIDVLYRDFESSKESLLFLIGKPGVGKTTFIRYALLKCANKKIKQSVDGDIWTESKIAYVKDSSVMMQSEFWSMLAQKHYEYIIFDDLDFSLAKRTGQDNGFVSNLLSFSDGVFGSQSKIIITTNTEVNDIDSALLRDGRCFDFLSLRPLTRNSALYIWIDILGMEKEDFIDKWPQSTKEILQASLISFYYRVTNNRRERQYVKNGLRIYNVEDKINKALEDKRLGFAKC